MVPVAFLRKFILNDMYFGVFKKLGQNIFDIFMEKSCSKKVFKFLIILFVGGWLPQYSFHHAMFALSFF